MDRRSFITTLIGGFAVAGLGGAALAQTPEAAQPVALKRDPVEDGVKLDSEALDKALLRLPLPHLVRRSTKPTPNSRSIIIAGVGASIAGPMAIVAAAFTAVVPAASTGAPVRVDRAF